MNKLASVKNCFGCGTCSLVCPVDAIKMQENSKGFLYPKCDESICRSCGKCFQVCDNIHESNRLKSSGEIYILQHKDIESLKKSSSGGAFIALSDAILNDKGIVVGAVFDPNTKKIIHNIADVEVTRDKMCGSKYVQSYAYNTFDSIKKELLSGKKVLFSGTPCQVAALYSFLGKTNIDNLFTIDLICHGAPSPLVFSSFIDCLEKKKDAKIVDFQFRSKKYGYEYTTCITYENGKKDSSLGAKQLLKLYTLNMRESCYYCPFASRDRVGDITIGDLWKKPKDINEKKHIGYSTIIINSDNGKALYDSILKDVFSTPNCTILENRQALSHPVNRRDKVDLFWGDFFDYGIEYVLNKYAHISMKSRIYFFIKKMLYFFKQYWLLEFLKNKVE